MALTSIYRYRSPTYLLDELRNHYFYFAPTFNENDIYENHPIFIFHGTKDMWEGLFKYYYYYVYINFSKQHFDIKNIDFKGFLNDVVIRYIINYLSNNHCQLNKSRLRGLFAIIYETSMRYVRIDYYINSNFYNLAHKNIVLSKDYWKIYYLDHNLKFWWGVEFFLHKLKNKDIHMEKYYQNMYQVCMCKNDER